MKCINCKLETNNIFWPNNHKKCYAKCNNCIYSIQKQPFNKWNMAKEGYNYMRYLGDGEHLLENIEGKKPYQFEVWFANKNHASYGLIYKNTHLEFARSQL